MGRPRQRTMRTARRYRPSLEGLALPIGISFLLLVPGCAQLDQLMGKQAGAGESAPVTPAHENRPVLTTEPASKPDAKKKADQSQPESVSKQPEQDKALAEKDQLKKENKARAASDKKSRKSPKSQAEAQPPTEDVFLPPIPLPSKPAAIGGSGG